MNATQLIETLFPAISEENEELLIEQSDIIVHKLKFINNENRPTVFVKNESPNIPSSTADIVHHLIRIAGGIPSAHILDADILLLPHEGSWVYDFDALSSDISISGSKAYKEDHLYYIQKKRLVDFSTEMNFLASLESLAEILQPTYFAYGREGEDWIKFNLNY